MSDQANSKPNGAEPTPQPKSLREVAEDAYDEVLDAAEEPGDEPEDLPAGQDGRARDSLGRFVAKTSETEPGEAERPQDASQPREGQEAPDGAKPVDPAHGSSQPPQHWSEQDRKIFSELPQAGQEFLLRRHSEMERDYQGKVQANAQAVQFTQALGPIFNDPAIAGSLRENNLSVAGAISQWAAMHRRAVSPDMRDRATLWHEMGVAMGLDPAAVYGQGQSGTPQGALSQEQLADPAIKYFADHVSRTAQEVQALRGQIVGMQQAAQDRANAEALKVTRWGIDSFAAEKDKQGNPLRPDFDVLLPQIIELFQANPQRDLREAYETARWMHPQVRERLVAAERQQVQQRASAERAKQATRLNARGVTSPVSKPADAAGSKSLRDTLEQAADEVGFG